MHTAVILVFNLPWNSISVHLWSFIYVSRLSLDILHNFTCAPNFKLVFTASKLCNICDWFMLLHLHPAVLWVTLSCFTWCLSVERNAISVYHMTKVMGVIFHQARIERLMKVDGEGKVLNKKRLGGEMRCIKTKEVREKVNTYSPSLISLLHCSP